MRTPISYVCPICGNRLPRAAARCFFCEQPLPVRKGPPADAAFAATTDLPPLHVPARDFARLERLARTGLFSQDFAARQLLRAELDRAVVCAPDDIPGDVVRMGATVRVRDGDGRRPPQEICGVLVYPGEWPERSTAIPVTTSLGAAILGLGVGDVMSYDGDDGSRHAVRIVSVAPPAPWPPSPPPSPSRPAAA